MSYDLFFARQRGGELSLTAFQSYFEGRPNWNVRATQASYCNENTSVYFGFDHGEEAVAEGEVGAAVPVDGGFERVAAFTINYLRPHYFGLEAAPELSAFVAEFDLVVDDPQLNGMGRGEFSVEGFLAGWNAGNRFAHEAILTQHPNEIFHSLPTLDPQRHWLWNRSRESLQQEVGDAVFVPKIMYHLIDGKVRSGLVWGDVIPSFLPVVDTLFVPRHEHAPRRFLRRTQDLVCLEWEEAAQIVAEYPLAQSPVPHYRLTYTEAPETLARFIRSRRPFETKIAGLPTESVLNAELVAAARKNDST